MKHLILLLVPTLCLAQPVDVEPVADVCETQHINIEQLNELKTCFLLSVLEGEFTWRFLGRDYQQNITREKATIVLKKLLMSTDSSATLYEFTKYCDDIYDLLYDPLQCPIVMLWEDTVVNTIWVMRQRSDFHLYKPLLIEQYRGAGVIRGVIDGLY